MWQDTVRGGLLETDDERGAFVPGVVDSMGPVQGVWGGDGDWVTGGPHADTEC